MEGLLAQNYLLLRIMTDYPCDHVAIPVERANEVSALQAALSYPTRVIRGQKLALTFAGVNATLMYSECTVLNSNGAPGGEQVVKTDGIESSQIVFIQEDAPRDYGNITDLAQCALGGTEASVLRIARSLDASVYCMGETPTETSGFAVHVRSAWTLPKTPARRHFLWLHDNVGDRIDAQLYALLEKHRPTLIFPSHYLRQRWTIALRATASSEFIWPAIAVISNPVEVATIPRAKPIKTTVPTFLWAAAPQKGLSYALDAIAEVRATSLPNALLKVAYPEYAADEFQNEFAKLCHAPGIEVLHALPHAELLEKFAASDVLLHTNPQFAGFVSKTCGRVLAREACQARDIGRVR